jgi:O-antigen/teichoic acid export membrane protein
VLYALIFIGAPLAAQFYNQALITDLIRAHGLIILIFTFYFVPRNILKRDLSFKELALIDNLALFASSIIMVIMAYLGFGAWAIIAAEIGKRAGQLLLTQFFKPFWPKFQFNWQEVRSLVQFGIYATGSRLLYNLYSNADYLIVGRVFGAEAVGIYTLAYRIVSDTVKTLTSNLNEVAYPAFARLQNEIKRLRKYFFTIARASLQLNSILLIIITVFIDEILLLGGYEEYMGAVPLIQLLAATAILRTVSPLVPQLLNALGEARLNFYYSLSNAIIMPVAFLIGAQFSLIGVGFAWLIGYPVVVLLLFYFASRLLQVSLPRFIAHTFKGIWTVPLLLGVAWASQATLSTLLTPTSVVVPIGGILLTLAIGLSILYLIERDTIKLLYGRSKM